MEDRLHDNRIYYQERPHHRQQLRQHIFPQTIDKLEVNQNPSAITRKACQSLYHDQLEKEILARNNTKQQGKPTNGTFNADCYRQKGKSTSVFQDCSNFRDYERQKNSKIMEHINANYDGGTAFYRASQMHQSMRQKNYKQLCSTIKSQLNTKLSQNQNARQQKNHQTYLRIQTLQRLQKQMQEQKTNSTKMKQNHRSQFLKQMQEQRSRKMSQQKAGYNYGSGRHNPITNPIEYHIQNPYILKQIQDSKNFKESRL